MNRFTKFKKTCPFIPTKIDLFYPATIFNIIIYWRNTMNALIDVDIDYEHMDDLPLSDRIEWNHIKFEKVVPDDWDDQIESQTE